MCARKFGWYTRRRGVTRYFGFVALPVDILGRFWVFDRLREARKETLQGKQKVDV